MNHESTPRIRLAAVLSVALAGAASMATSPADRGQRGPQMFLTVEAPLPAFDLSSDAPEVLLDLQIREIGVASSTVSGQLDADLTLRADAAVDVVTTFEVDGEDSGLFTKTYVTNEAAVTISSAISGRATLRIRSLGNAPVSGDGMVTVRFPVTATATAADQFEVRIDPR